jgi:hypothetical protein
MLKGFPIRHGFGNAIGQTRRSPMTRLFRGLSLGVVLFLAVLAFNTWVSMVQGMYPPR